MAGLSEMTDEQLKALIKESASAAAEEAVKQMFMQLGIDHSNPIEMQADMRYLRDWRTSTATVRRQGLMVAIGIIVTGVLGLIWKTVAYAPPAH